MTKLMALLALAGLLHPALAQQADGAGAQRERIKAERAEAEAVFRTAEKACYSKFAVTDCLNAAKARRREVLADLRRQEVSLNDEERRRKAAERLRAVEERTSREQPSRAPSAPSAPATPATPPARPASARAASERPASEEASRAAKAASRQAQSERKQAEKAEKAAGGDRTNDAARNRERHEERLAKAAERRAKLEKRLAERKKPPAQPLPAAP